jgi:hypothetical protein
MTVLKKGIRVKCIKKHEYLDVGVWYKLAEDFDIDEDFWIRVYYKEAKQDGFQRASEFFDLENPSWNHDTEYYIHIKATNIFSGPFVLEEEALNYLKLDNLSKDLEEVQLLKLIKVYVCKTVKEWI